MINIVEDIKNTFKEAETRNYSEYILNYDLEKVLNNYYRYYLKCVNESYNDGYDCGYEEAKDECFSDAYDDGYEEGKSDMREKFIRMLATYVLTLKNNIRENPTLSHKKIQTMITEMLLAMDEEEYLDYHDFELIDSEEYLFE